MKRSYASGADAVIALSPCDIASGQAYLHPFYAEMAAVIKYIMGMVGSHNF